MRHPIPNTGFVRSEINAFPAIRKTYRQIKPSATFRPRYKVLFRDPSDPYISDIPDNARHISKAAHNPPCFVRHSIRNTAMSTTALPHVPPIRPKHNPLSRKRYIITRYSKYFGNDIQTVPEILHNDIASSRTSPKRYNGIYCTPPRTAHSPQTGATFPCTADIRFWQPHAFQYTNRWYAFRHETVVGKESV